MGRGQWHEREGERVPGGGFREERKKGARYTQFPKIAHRLGAIGGWRLVAVDGGWWRLVAVGGG